MAARDTQATVAARRAAIPFQLHEYAHVAGGAATFVPIGKP